MRVDDVAGNMCLGPYTPGEVTATAAMRDALLDIISVCDHVHDTFHTKVGWCRWPETLVESAWFLRLILKHDNLLSSLTFHVNLRLNGRGV